MGSKNRIAKHILPIVLKNRKCDQYYVEPFVGGANIIDKVGGNRIAGDINAHLIECWKGLQNGWTPPAEITRLMYNSARDAYNRNDLPTALVGYIGFSGSYGGRFFEGGYAGITKTKQGETRNYPVEAFNNVMSQVDAIKDILFVSGSYQQLMIPKNSIIYCDPPYVGTKEYAKAGFNSSKFWQWCREKATDGHDIFISEYDAPDGFSCIWKKEVKSSLSANGKIGGNKISVERLFALHAN